jgi:hypothetical protein
VKGAQDNRVARYDNRENPTADALRIVRSRRQFEQKIGRDKPCQHHFDLSGRDFRHRPVCFGASLNSGRAICPVNVLLPISYAYLTVGVTRFLVKTGRIL